MFSYDSTEYAIIIEDSVKAVNFKTIVPINQATTNDNKWSNNFTLNDGEGVYNKWFTWVVIFNKQKHYSLSDSEAFANVMLLGGNLDAGVHMYKKVNGAFKRLSFQINRDISNNVTDVTITICE